jgi:glycosyltransferase involved in cell wall biosynthesis
VHKDLKRFYPSRKYPQIGVLRFAVFNDLRNENFEPMEFDRPYFICPNQFWAHKNQELILKAVQYMGEVSLPFYVVFTGKMFDSRKNNHFRDIIEPLLNNKFVKNNVKLLGFIDRDIQLNLINRAIALIQPSRFEGWSTVIEDAMSMNLKVLASNLEVNIEQLGSKAQYFDVDDYIGLGNMMQQFNLIGIKKTNYLYIEKQLKFATDFLEIIKD